MHLRLSILLLLLSALPLVACGDDDQVDPSNPDASAAKDAAREAEIADGSKDSARDVARDAGSGGQDAQGDSPPE
jgi:hypothetical protein